MVKEKSWEEFRDSGLFWLVNTFLHTFGWALVAEMKNETVVKVYPARVKFRGFSEKINDEGYIKVSEYLKENIDELEKESKE